MGCKTDLTERRLISPKEGNDLANKLGFVYMECSAVSTRTHAFPLSELIPLSMHASID